ncbi:MAG: hypothetical protein ACOY90_07730 [Candidatus Zhuqueibacterota bacterium]
MEKFIKFKREVSVAELEKAQTDKRIIILRKSQTTDTIQIQVPKGMTSKEIKKAFGDFEVTKVYSEFPYPIQYEGLSRYFVLPFIKLIQKTS